MNITPPSISVASQQLTPAKVAWVMDAGHSTVEEWLRKGELGHFKKGRFVRIAPEELLRFIVRHTVRRRNAATGTCPLRLLEPDDVEMLWGRIERLVREEVRAALATAERTERAA